MLVYKKIITDWYIKKKQFKKQNIKIWALLLSKEKNLTAVSLTDALLFQGQQCNSIRAVKLTGVRFFSLDYSYSLKTIGLILKLKYRRFPPCDGIALYFLFSRGSNIFTKSRLVLLYLHPYMIHPHLTYIPWNSHNTNG
jgi:hypothetical protein